MTILYRGHPGLNYQQTDETRGLSFSEKKETAINYARDHLFNGRHASCFVTTVSFTGSITVSTENVFRGPKSFKNIIKLYPPSRHDAAKTGDGTLVVVYNLQKIIVIACENVSID